MGVLLRLPLLWRRKVGVRAGRLERRLLFSAERSAIEITIGDGVLIRVKAGLENAELTFAERGKIVGLRVADEDFVLKEGTAGFNIPYRREEQGGEQEGQNQDARFHGSLRSSSEVESMRQPLSAKT